MLQRKFADLPSEMQNETVKRYYDALKAKKWQLLAKRGIDVALSLVFLILLAPLMFAVAVVIRSDSPGGAIFRQKRVKRYLEPFTIYKFRTMRVEETQNGGITPAHDKRVTRVGRFLRRTRIDELPQLFNVLKGDLSLVGPRPELPEYVALYDEAMLATLLIPVGITSPASLRFKNEADVLDTPQNGRVYAELILPRKMMINIDYLQNFSLLADLRVLLLTLAGALTGADAPVDGSCWKR